MVPKTSELLPEPETPVKAVRRRFGSSTLTSLRLFSRAPWTRIRSCWSAACVLIGSPGSAGSGSHGSDERQDRIVTNPANLLEPQLEVTPDENGFVDEDDAELLSYAVAHL